MDYLEVCCLVYRYLEIFPDIFQLLISRVREHTLYVFNILKFVKILWPRIWSVLVNVPRMLEKNVYPPAVGWSVVYTSVGRLKKKI